MYAIRSHYGVAIPAPRSLELGCAFLGAAGCLFPVSDQPCQCLALVPNRQTLEQSEGCLCREPEAFSRAAGRRRWQGYWQTVSSGRWSLRDRITSYNVCYTKLLRLEPVLPLYARYEDIN